jgi:hypothetical protein
MKRIYRVAPKWQDALLPTDEARQRELRQTANNMAIIAGMFIVVALFLLCNRNELASWLTWLWAQW